MNDSGVTWMHEVLDVLEHRRRIVVATAVGVSVVGLVVAWLAPDLLPPNALVGAAVGFAAVLLAIAAALGVDSVDLTVRGTRHVRAAGADVVGLLPGPPDSEATSELAGVLADLDRAPFRIALAPVSRAISTVPRWTDALAVELSRRDRRVVVLDLASGPDLSGHPGVLEVVRDGLKLGQAVRFDPDLLLARLGPGGDDEAALAAWPRLADNIPSDVDVLLVALPPVTHPGVLGAMSATDQAWLFASIDRTARVDLIAGLDAADRTGTPTEVVLLDPSQGRPAPTEVGVAAPAALSDEEDWPEADVGLDQPADAEAGADDDQDAVVAVDHDETGSTLAELQTLARSGDEAPEEAEERRDEPLDDAVHDELPSQEVASLAEDSWDAAAQPAPPADSSPPEEPRDDATEPTQPEDAPPPEEAPAGEPHEATLLDDATEPPTPQPDEPQVEAGQDAATGDRDADVPATDEESPREPDEELPGEPTDELPPIRLDDGPVAQPDRWAPPNDQVNGGYAPPLAGRDDNDDPVRVAAALQTLAQEVWDRPDESS